MEGAWDRTSVLALSPDTSSSVAADKLAARGRWLDHGVGQTESGDTVAWGICQGSAASAYQAVVAPGPPPRHNCSCPSRKSPCKHALALLLLWSDRALSRAVLPGFVVEWWGRQGDGAGGDRPTRPPGVLADPEAAARRAEARAQRVEAGLADLDRWLSDQVRGGIAHLERVGYAHFDAVAARMVDAQAPGVAGMLRAIPGQMTGAGWPDRVLAQLSALRLLIQAHRGIRDLPEPLAATVRSRMGYPVSRASVLATPGVRDVWQAVGQVDTVEFQLESRRVWLLGRETGRWAMWMSFAAPGAVLDDSVRPGQRYRGDLHFYAGAGQFRALPGETWVARQGLAPVAAVSLSDATERFAGLVADDPWADRMPVIIDGVVVPPAEGREGWTLVDRHGIGCRLETRDDDPWDLVAASMNGPVPIMGEWRPSGFKALAALVDHGPHDEEVSW